MVKCKYLVIKLQLFFCTQMVMYFLNLIYMEPILGIRWWRK